MKEDAIDNAPSDSPESLDVKESLNDALDELHPNAELPDQDLFKLDGLGQRPESPNGNMTGYFGPDQSGADDSSV